MINDFNSRQMDVGIQLQFEWDPYDTLNRKTMVFNTPTLQMVQMYDDNHCHFWNGLDYDWLL